MNVLSLLVAVATFAHLRTSYRTASKYGVFSGDETSVKVIARLSGESFKADMSSFRRAR